MPDQPNSTEPRPGHESAPRRDAEAPLPVLKGSVLVADDKVHTQRLITSCLEGTGATVRVVDNGLKAVQTALSDAFDLLLMNTRMPVLDGVSALGLLRRAGYRGAAVALTAEFHPAEVEHLHRLGFQEALAEPLELPRLRELLSRFLADAGDAQQALPSDSAAALVQRLAAEFMANRRDTQEALREALAAADGSALHPLTHAIDAARLDLARRGGLQLMKALRGVAPPDAPPAAPAN